MALDSRIPLMLGDTGEPFRLLAQTAQQNRQNTVDQEKIQMLREQAMRQQQTHKNQQETHDNTIDDHRITEFYRNVVPAAETVSGMIASEDIPGAISFLDRRIADLDREEIDSSDTKEVKGLLESGQIPAAMSELNNVIAQGRAMGIATDSGATTSGMSKIFGNGTSMQLFNNGARQVQLADGRVVEGEEAASALDEGRKADIRDQLERAAGRRQGSENESRDAETINRGIALAESTATLRRGIELLQLVETGGPESISLRMKQSLGVETADEGELSSALGKSVLSQLRETFGAQFTESEGKRLERIEANFGKSNAANIRLLNQALRMAERTAQRARGIASDKGLTAVVQDIDDLLTFSLSTSEDGDNQVGRFKVEVVK